MEVVPPVTTEQVEKLTREFNFHYRDCIGPLIYLLPKIVDLSFAVQKLAKFTSNTDKVHYEVLLHLLRYIRENRTLGLNYYDDMKDAPLSELLRKASIKTKNQLMAFSDSSWQYFPDTDRSTVEYIISIKVVQLTTEHMLQDQFLNQV